MGDVAIIAAAMSDFAFTSEQDEAIKTVDRSVIVSAAAGSGKTAVLAERCVYLVCDAPPPYRCNIDELLVLTFTSAAAAEMRGRILDKLAQRVEQASTDPRLRDQLNRVNTAQISTIHSFCTWMLRRWFSEAEIDPTAELLDEKEQIVLRREVLDELFESKYAALASECNSTSPFAVGRLVDAVLEPTGASSLGDGESKANFPKDSAEAFHQLIDVYGLGDDSTIARFVLRLHSFLESITEPERWLDEAVAAVESQPEEYVLAAIDLLRAELGRQMQYCNELAAEWQQTIPSSDPYLQRLQLYGDQLEAWLTQLPKYHSAPISIEDAFRRFDEVRDGIGAFRFKNLPGGTSEKANDSAFGSTQNDVYEELKKTMIKGRLKDSLVAQSSGELLASVRQTAPFVKTIVGIVREFMQRFRERKRQLAVMDFADLERIAYELLRSKEDAEKPSPIATQLHERFAHVLLDEFQDINPLQRSILRLVSRETDPQSAGNLFVVGDVKQSIYRFRQAEPALFLDRWNEFHRRAVANESHNSAGSAISLQRNYRSRKEIIDTVNMIFRQLMRGGTSAIVYADEAELRLGKEWEASGSCQVELHLLEAKATAPENEDGEEEPVEEVSEGAALTDADQPTRWQPIEREAYLIGSRIREMQSNSILVDGRPLRFDQIAILLRAKKVNARLVASVLSKMGIPSVADESGSLFEAREIRDVLTGLQLLDNQHQDIPLASVMRSGLFGVLFSEDELIEIRHLDCSVSFHEVVSQYAEKGSDDGLRERLQVLLKRLNRSRADFQRKPLPDALASLYDSFGYFAYLGGLPQGSSRQANLHALHDLARKHSSFRRQGLHRFLAFLQSLQDGETELSAATSSLGAQDAVRIISIHGSKGLQFPVVFLAGMGTKINFQDRNNRLIFERQSKIGLRAIDTRRMVESPSAAHMLAAAEIERTTREEEMRLLYVAMTRAQEKLVLVGSQPHIDSIDLSTTVNRSVTEFEITRAKSYLDWVVPILVEAKASLAKTTHQDAVPFTIAKHDSAEISEWRLDSQGTREGGEIRNAVAKGDPLPLANEHANDESLRRELRNRLSYVYPNLASTTQRSAMGASEFKGAFDFTQNPEAAAEGGRKSVSIHVDRPATESRDTAATRGIVNHRVLQHLDFAAAFNSGGVDRELQRMLAAKLINADESILVDRQSIEWFVSTPLAETLRRAGERYRREFTYIFKERPGFLDRTIHDEDESVLVRGIIDGILESATGLEIVDFKTDAIRAEEAEARGAHYKPQMQMYARAMTNIWKKPVTTCHLVFLAARRIVSLSQDQLGVLDHATPTL